MTDTVSIETLKMAQRDLDLCDVHLVHLGQQGFTIAHTDEERASETPLEDCDLHTWLVDIDGPPVEPNVYVALPHEVDAYSESYPVPRWDFLPINEYQGLTAIAPDHQGGDTGSEEG